MIATLARGAVNRFVRMAALAGLGLAGLGPIAPASAEPVPAVPPAIGRCSGCGCAGGPGYRGPDGRCVGWRNLTEICGDPPTTRCRAELVRSERPARRPEAAPARPTILAPNPFR